MKIKANKKWRNIDYRYIIELKDFKGLSAVELDIATKGIPFEGGRYPLNYVFWQKQNHRKVNILFKNNPEEGLQVGECLVNAFHDTPAHARAIIRVSDGRITDIAYRMIAFV
jgi:hypothetical protein